MKPCNTLFVFQRDGIFLDEIKGGSDLSAHIILTGIAGRPLFLYREKQERHADGTTKFIWYREEQKQEDNGYMRAIAEELRNRNFHVYEFNERKSEVGRLLLSLHLKPKDILEFFDKLIAVPESALKELKQEIEEDMKALAA